MLKKDTKQMIAEANAVVTTITTDDAKALAGQPDVVMVDVREPGELKENGQIEGALNVPRGVLEFQADPGHPSYNQALDGSKRIVIYCATGGRSALAAKSLIDMGIENVCHVAGGIKAWKEAGNPVS